MKINGWESKRQNGRWLGSVIDSLGGIQAKVLSAGAGLGVVEEELIRQDYNIELQDCQGKSFRYIKTRGIDDIKLWTGPDLTELPSRHYDVVYSNLMVYALKDNEYDTFLVECNRILKDQGTLIITDVVAYIEWFILQPVVLLKHKLDKRPRVFWGFKRSADMHKKVAEKHGFKLQEIVGFDDNGNVSEKNITTKAFIYKKEG